MSLRDDLKTVGYSIGNERFEAYNRLHALLTPAAEAWLAALPALMEMEGKATPGPWGTRKDGSIQLPLGVDTNPQFVKGNAHLICALRNALASAKAADEKEKA